MAEQQIEKQTTNLSELLKVRLKERSPNFPFISLEVALRRAQELYDHEKRSTAPIAVVADHWGYSETSSGAQQTVGALRAYGLLDDEGKGTARRLKLSASALRILLDTRPDSIERDQLKRDAARKPAIFAEIYERWPSSIPSEPNLRHYLIFGRKLSEDAAKKACTIFFENETFTNSSRSVVISNNTVNKNDVIEVREPYLTQDKQQQTLSGFASPRSYGNFRQDVFSLDEGPVVLRWPEKLSAASYEDFESWIQLQLKKIKRSIVSQ